MRYLLLSLLVAAPIPLLVWIAWRGSNPPQHEKPAPPVHEAPVASAAAKTATAAKAAENAVQKTAQEILAAPFGAAKLKAEVATYDRERLFDYINGAAPLYIERGFVKLAAGEMTTADGGELTCDVYDMGEPANAASIAQAERSDGAQVPPDWPEAKKGPMSFVFHRSRYYVKLTAFDARAEGRLPALARELAERM